jgi:hypothetical protein
VLLFGEPQRFLEALHTAWLPDFVPNKKEAKHFFLQVLTLKKVDVNGASRCEHVQDKVILGHAILER